MSSIASANKKKIALVAARIFQTALNDTNVPTGRKLLKKALVGPRLTSWYPEGIRKMDMLFEDPDDGRAEDAKTEEPEENAGSKSHDE